MTIRRPAPSSRLTTPDVPWYNERPRRPGKGGSPGSAPPRADRSGALLLGGALGAYWQVPRKLRGTLLAFAAGCLISVLAFELFAEAVAEGGLVRSSLGLIVGAFAFVLAKIALDARIEHPGAKSMDVMRMAAERGMGLALLLGVILDGIPESAALGGRSRGSGAFPF